MPTNSERLDTQKATVYDLQKILKKIKKEGADTIKIDDALDLMDSYIEGCEAK